MLATTKQWSAAMSDTLPTATRVSDPGLRALYLQESRWQAWLDVEVALAKAQEELGIIPQGAAAAIGAAARLEKLDRNRIDEGLARTGHTLVPLVWELSRVTGDGDGLVVATLEKFHDLRLVVVAGGEILLGAQDVLPTGVAVEVPEAAAVRLEDRVLQFEYLEAVAVLRLRDGVVHHEAAAGEERVVPVGAGFVREAGVRGGSPATTAARSCRWRCTRRARARAQVRGGRCREEGRGRHSFNSLSRHWFPIGVRLTDGGPCSRSGKGHCARGERPYQEEAGSSPCVPTTSAQGQADTGMRCSNP